MLFPLKTEYEFSNDGLDMRAPRQRSLLIEVDGKEQFQLEATVEFLDDGPYSKAVLDLQITQALVGAEKILEFTHSTMFSGVFERSIVDPEDMTGTANQFLENCFSQ